MWGHSELRGYRLILLGRIECKRVKIIHIYSGCVLLCYIEVLLSLRRKRECRASLLYHTRSSLKWRLKRWLFRKRIHGQRLGQTILCLKWTVDIVCRHGLTLNLSCRLCCWSHLKISCRFCLNALSSRLLPEVVWRDHRAVLLQLLLLFFIQFCWLLASHAVDCCDRFTLLHNFSRYLHAVWKSRRLFLFRIRTHTSAEWRTNHFLLSLLDLHWR